ncbi:MAG TPA: hypothetical protein VJO16_21785 [Candidatus Acidoferrum sp.]|nr:hypothetical protein [Candidatus Acidoferrum sp.]
MPGHHPNPSLDNEAQFGRIVANLFREDGWKVLEEPREKNVAPDFLVSGHGKKLVVELKRASEGRKDRVIPLLSQAALEAVHYSRVIPGHPVPLAIVGANRIPDSVAEEAKQFVRERAPEVAIGVLDLEGFRLFAGHGLESLSSARRPQSDLRPPKVRAPQLFSDLNQWMLKVLLAPRIPDVYLSAPRGRYQGASQLAEAAGVSVMSAFRFVEEFSKEGFLDSGRGVLRLVRSRELMNRWVAASQRRVLEIPMRWVLHRGKKALGSALRSYQSDQRVPFSNLADQLSSPRPRLCLGLFEAAEALGIGFVHGVKPYLYLERLNAEVLKDLGLSGEAEEKEADLFVRIPGNRESVFRGVVRKDDVPVSDILQVWLDVGQHPSRGKEQADLIWRKILSSAFESSEP